MNLTPIRQSRQFARRGQVPDLALHAVLNIREPCSQGTESGVKRPVASQVGERHLIVGCAVGPDVVVQPTRDDRAVRVGDGRFGLIVSSTSNLERNLAPRLYL